MGKSSTRLPVALKIALATAAPVPVMPLSPTPRAPMGVCGSGMSFHRMSISGTSRWTGTWYSARLGFMMRPQSNEPGNRVTHGSPH